MGMPFQQAGTALKAARILVRARALFGYRIGITGRLGISFLAVGILAAIANLIVEESVSIIQTTRVEPASTTPLSMETPPKSLPHDLSAQAAPAPARPVVSTEPLALSVDSFQRAIEIRARAANMENDAIVTQAEAELVSLAATYARQRGPDHRASVRELGRALNRYRELGTALIAETDKREALNEAYLEKLDAMNARILRSMDQAWKILGRVLARQSLLQLRNDHDELRRRYASFSSTPDDGAALLDAVIRAETAFGVTLNTNERGFARSEGVEWVRSMKEDVESIGMLRQSFVEQRVNVTGLQPQFNEAHDAVRLKLKSLGKLVDVVPGKNGPGNAHAEASRQEPVTVPGAGNVAPAVASAPEADVPLAGKSTRTTETLVSKRPLPESTRALVAWLSGAIVMTVLLISIVTVRSVVVPIRRLLKATGQLAKGELYVPLPNGGLKELDVLAGSFNKMADELIAHRSRLERSQQDLERRVAERTSQLEILAACDPLTGLPNRRQLLSLLEEALTNARVHDHLLGVFFLELDNFKNINDSMGHSFGDRVLTSIAQRLREITLDVGFAARLGGDEFTVVIAGYRTVEDVRNAGLRMISAFQNPISLENRELIISVSIGASIYPDHEQTSDGLLRAADAALFRAKALGRSQLSVYTPELLEAAADKFTTEQGLRRAVERGEFELVFQPEISADTLQTTLVEALIRWRLPDGTLVSPGEFLAVAEESGLIVEISEWVLRSAIQAASHWHHGDWPEAKVAINVSPRQLLDYRFVEKVQQLLAEFRLPASAIEIELTESVLQTGPSTIDTLYRLRKCGIAIALDDFGTGYSTLASLEQSPFTRIKLDRSLISSIDTNARSAAIARAIIGLCQNLNLEVTAEGVERPEQFSILMAHRPMCIQGYLVSKPVAADCLVATIKRIAQEVPLLLLTAMRSAPEANGEKGPLAVSEQAIRRIAR